MRSVSRLIFKQPNWEAVAAEAAEDGRRGVVVQRVKGKENRCWRREKGKGEASQNELGVCLRSMPSVV